MKKILAVILATLLIVAGLVGVSSPASAGGNHGGDRDFDWNWSYEDPTCSGGLKVKYPRDLPDGQSNDVNIRIKNLSTDEVKTLNFHNERGTWSGTQTFKVSDKVKWSYFEYQWVQVGGTNYHWEGSVICGTPPKPIQPAPKIETIPTEGEPVCTTPDGGGAVSISTVTRTTPYIFNKKSNTWVLGTPTDSKPVISYREATLVECPTLVTPEFTKVNPPTCDADGYFADPVEPELGYSLAFDRDFNGPGIYTETATANPGFKINGPTTNTVTVLGKTGHQSTDPEADCYVPPAPTVIDDVIFPPVGPATCDAGQQLPALPVDTDQVKWSADGNTFTATAKPGFSFRDGKESQSFPYELSGKLTGEDCETPPVVKPPVVIPPTTDTPPVVTPVEKVVEAVPVVEAPKAELAATGSDLAWLGWTIIILLIAGVGLLGLSRYNKK